MPTLKKSLVQLKQEAATLLQRSGKVTNLNDGGVAKSLLDIFATQLADYYNALDFQSQMANLSTSAGIFLDFIGQSRGVFRLGSQAATVLDTDENIKFYSKDGKTPIKTLLPLNKVPSGTVVSSSDGSINYNTTTDSYPDDTQTSIFVAATSSSTGAAQNVGPGILNISNLGVSTIAVVNTDSIGSAQDIETDTNYRFRISRAMSAAVGGTQDAIKLAAFSVPGVSNVVLNEFSNGTGTFDVLVVPVGDTLPEDTLRQVESLIQEVSAFGTKATVKTPEPLYAQLTIQLVFVPNLTDTNRVTIKSQARQAILNYLGAIPLGGVFVVDQLIQKVLDVSASIQDMKILQYKFRGVNQVIKNIQSDADESFIPDQTVDNPIQVV